MPYPAVRSEIDEIADYLADQAAAIRNAAYGLTEEQARQTPCRSTLSIGGLIKHATYVMTGRERRKALVLGNASETDFAAGAKQFIASFALGEDETMESALAAFDRAVESYLTEVRADDPDADAVEPPSPWQGINEPIPIRQRFYLLHHIEELARHAGHADVIREQLDGAKAGELRAAIEGWEPNDFVKPWKPPVG